MNFTCHTVCRQKTLTVLSRALRKTVRRKSSRAFHIYGWLCVALGISVVFSARWMWLRWLDGAAILLLASVLLFGDAIDGFFARKMADPGTEEVTLTFFPEGYTAEDGNGVTQWSYEQVLALAETESYILLALGRKQGQICEKAGLQGGTLEEFRIFLAEKTQKEIVQIGR